MEVNEELTLEVNPASVLARRASLNVGRSGSGLGLSSFATSGSNHDVSLLTQQLRRVRAAHRGTQAINVSSLSPFARMLLAEQERKNMHKFWMCVRRRVWA